MPFTLAHPVVVTPLRKHGFILSALVVGSMTPDLGFYVSFGPLGDRSHHELADLLTFCLPAGLIVLWVFHRVLTETFLFVELLLVSVAIHAKGIAERVSDSNKQETP